MPGEGVHLAPGRMARIAGGCYLAFVLASVLAGVLGHIGMGGAEQVYQAIVTNAGAFRLALVVALASALLFLIAASVIASVADDHRLTRDEVDQVLKDLAEDKRTKLLTEAREEPAPRAVKSRGIATGATPTAARPAVLP